MRVDLIYPALPPAPDAIGDHVALLASTLAESGQRVRIFTENSRCEIDGVEVLDIGVRSDPFAIIRRSITFPPDAVLLQYNPFSWGTRGWCRRLVHAWRSYRKAFPSVRQSVMFHEIWTDHPTWQATMMRQWQRRQALALAKSSDCLLFSSQAYEEQFGRRLHADTRPSIVFPVGSNIPVKLIDRAAAKARLGIPQRTFVAGFFGTTHPSRLLHFVAKAVEAMRRSRADLIFLYVGPDVGEVRKSVFGSDLIADGRADSLEASYRICAMDLMLCPFSDGASFRRSSLMAGLSHGVPCVSTYSDSTDKALRELGSGLKLAKNDIDSFVEAAVEAISTPLSFVSPAIRSLAARPPVDRLIDLLRRKLL